MIFSRTELLYYLILFVYVFLWACQLAACHLTHSLIILTESYINLYRILDVSLGIVHLRTQKALAEHRDKPSGHVGSKQHPTLAGWLLSSTCTYQFKRLPLLGSFVNGLFLAALLISAAIEGIQTCFHRSHVMGHEEKTILQESELTYPLTLVGFALVGLVMQYCSMKAHEMREEELCSASLMDLALRPSGESVVAIKELNVNNLQFEQAKQQESRAKRRSYDLTRADKRANSTTADDQEEHAGELPLAIRTSEIAYDDDDRAANGISLKSFRYSLNLESVSPTPGPISNSSRDNMFLVRTLTSPLALLACAAIFYFVHDELFTEISDAMLALTVIVLMFVASYKPMKRAGRILLQAIPDGMDLAELERELAQMSPLILEVRDLRVWCLTPRSNRVATCSLVLDKRQIESDQQIKDIITEARYRFLDQGIKCTTVQPILSDLRQDIDAS